MANHAVLSAAISNKMTDSLVNKKNAGGEVQQGDALNNEEYEASTM